MNSAKTSTAQAADAKTEKRPPSGPTLIDPQLLKLIAGGAPKGGWCVSPTSETDPIELCAPKGGW